MRARRCDRSRPEWEATKGPMSVVEYVQQIGLRRRWSSPALVTTHRSTHKANREREAGVARGSSSAITGTPAGARRTRSRGYSRPRERAYVSPRSDLTRVGAEVGQLQRAGGERPEAHRCRRRAWRRSVRRSCPWSLPSRAQRTTGNTRWVTRSPGIQTVGLPSGASSRESLPTDGPRP